MGRSGEAHELNPHRNERRLTTSSKGRRSDFGAETSKVIFSGKNSWQELNYFLLVSTLFQVFFDSCSWFRPGRFPHTTELSSRCHMSGPSLVGNCAARFDPRRSQNTRPDTDLFIGRPRAHMSRAGRLNSPGTPAWHTPISDITPAALAASRRGLPRRAPPSVPSTPGRGVQQKITKQPFHHSSIT